MAVEAERERLHGVEVARGIAACLVVLYHAARHVDRNTGVMPFGSISQFGHAGVDFFFVLSGFIILFVHMGDIGRPKRARHYLERRLTRVLPLYWAMLAVTLAMLLASPLKALPDPVKIVADILLLPVGEPTLGIAWTLQYEMAFYVVFLALILHRGIGLGVFAAWGGLIVLTMLHPGAIDQTALALLGSAYCAQFFLGMAAAILVRQHRIAAPRGLLAGGAGGFLLAGGCENLGLLDGYGTPARFIYGGAATILLIGLVGAERAGLLRLPRPAVIIGSASYAIYLTHLLTIGVAWKLVMALKIVDVLPLELIYLAIVATAILAGVIVSRLIEHPLMGLMRRLLSDGRRAAGPRSSPAVGG